VNVYEVENCSGLPLHRDDEPIFVCDLVASVSFGQPRHFRVWHPEGGLAFDAPLCHGDLLLFPRMWEHEVLPRPKARNRPPARIEHARTAATHVRVNLTFRCV
jgi:alkylated DNA repair dioxygenase AlkB